MENYDTIVKYIFVEEVGHYDKRIFKGMNCVDTIQNLDAITPRRN